MSWRYQPVWIEENGENAFGLCEVYFDENDKLTAWTASPAIAPMGEDLEDLQGTLAHMMTDAYCWVAVKHSALCVGMTFEKRISMKDRNGIANLVNRWSIALKTAALPADEKER